MPFAYGDRVMLLRDPNWSKWTCDVTARMMVKCKM